MKHNPRAKHGVFVPTPNADIYSTSFVAEVPASYRALEILFGEPTMETEDGKVSTGWIFTETKTGAPVTLYEYEETDLYDPSYPCVNAFRSMPSYSWHVGAKEAATGKRFVKWLQAHLRLPSLARY